MKIKFITALSSKNIHFHTKLDVSNQIEPRRILALAAYEPITNKECPFKRHPYARYAPNLIWLRCDFLNRGNVFECII